MRVTSMAEATGSNTGLIVDGWQVCTAGEVMVGLRAGVCSQLAEAGRGRGKHRRHRDAGPTEETDSGNEIELGN